MRMRLDYARRQRTALAGDDRHAATVETFVAFGYRLDRVAADRNLAGAERSPRAVEDADVGKRSSDDLDQGRRDAAFLREQHVVSPASGAGVHRLDDDATRSQPFAQR
jgi:hypothetical protein